MPQNLVSREGEPSRGDALPAGTPFATFLQPCFFGVCVRVFPSPAGVFLNAALERMAIPARPAAICISSIDEPEVVSITLVLFSFEPATAVVQRQPIVGIDRVGVFGRL